MKTTQASDPYAHAKAGRRLEKTGNLRAAEAELRAAVGAADRLPLEDYKRDYNRELNQHALDSEYESLPGVDAKQLRAAYHELMALPFVTRLNLASFYARYDALEEAKEWCEQALAVGIDPVMKSDPHMIDYLERARAMQSSLEQAVGPDELQILFDEHLHRLDLDGDGFVHQTELRRAQFDVRITARGHKLIRHLLHHYYEIEAAHNDEFGPDIKGISRQDIKKFEHNRLSSWKRMRASGKYDAKTGVDTDEDEWDD